MSGAPTSLLVRWVTLVARNPLVVLFGLLLVTTAAGWIAVERYAMNSRLGDLIEQNADWRGDYEAFQAAFPQLVETALVVVSGQSFTQVEDAALRLEESIAAESTSFIDVYAPANEEFFRDNALLLMDIEQLEDVSDALAEAQPMLTAVAVDPSLRGVLQLVERALQNEVPSGFGTVLDNLARSAAAATQREDPTILWGDAFFTAKASDHYRIIFLRGQQNYGASLPNAQIVASLRHVIAATPLADGVTVRLTGEIALRHEEVQAAISGVQSAGLFASVLLAAVLSFGVRSLRIVAATFVLLIVGVVWTSAWAMLSVGSYNTLSLIFLVMFFGLGVDFCVHYCLRLQEALAVSDVQDLEAALIVATRSVGGAIALCSLTTAIGFLGFVPTPYKGLADLGMISAGGMLIACILTFTLLPALFAQFGAPAGRLYGSVTSSRFVAGLIRIRLPVLAILAVLVAGCFTLLPRTQFDYSVLALRDPSAESMQTLRELQREKQITDYALYTLTDLDALDRVKALTQLDTVERVTTPLDYVPSEQEEKLFALEDLEALLGSALVPGSAAATANALQVREAIESTSKTVARVLDEGDVSAELVKRARLLLEQLEFMKSAPDDITLAWERGVVNNLVDELAWLRRAIAAKELSFTDLPEKMRARLVSPTGDYLSAIVPAKDITPVASLSEFIHSVRDEHAGATGRPVVEWGVGSIVVGAFRTALLFAVVGISLVLFIVLRSIRNTVLVLTPLALTALFTIGTIVLIGVPVNMASVLVLPLIFGLGVDNGVHMVHRFYGDMADNGYDEYRKEENGKEENGKGKNIKDDSANLGALELMQSSTPRAVLLSTLTTIGTFAALMLSPHAGTASIGFLLTVAVGWLLVFTCLGLPLLMSLLSSHPVRRLGVLPS